MFEFIGKLIAKYYDHKAIVSNSKLSDAEVMECYNENMRWIEIFTLCDGKVSYDAIESVHLFAINVNAAIMEMKRRGMNHSCLVGLS